MWSLCYIVVKIVKFPKFLSKLTKFSQFCQNCPKCQHFDHVCHVDETTGLKCCKNHEFYKKWSFFPKTRVYTVFSKKREISVKITRLESTILQFFSKNILRDLENQGFWPVCKMCVVTGVTTGLFREMCRRRRQPQLFAKIRKNGHFSENTGVHRISWKIENFGQNHTSKIDDFAVFFKKYYVTSCTRPKNGTFVGKQE